jgi:hypothetical protein
VSSDDPQSDALSLLHDHGLGPIELETLLSMRGSMATAWTMSMLAARIGVPEPWVVYSVESLCTGGLLVEDGNALERRFFYRPGTPELEATVTTVAELYADRPADVIRAMNESALVRIRAAVLQAFPAAFMQRDEGER